MCESRRLSPLPLLPRDLTFLLSIFFPELLLSGTHSLLSRASLLHVRAPLTFFFVSSALSSVTGRTLRWEFVLSLSMVSPGSFFLLISSISTLLSPSPMFPFPFR